eukprot:2767915-Rhodomonas_salina.1
MRRRCWASGCTGHGGVRARARDILAGAGIHRAASCVPAAVARPWELAARDAGVLAVQAPHEGDQQAQVCSTMRRRRRMAMRIT